MKTTAHETTQALPLFLKDVDGALRVKTSVKAGGFGFEADPK